MEYSKLNKSNYNLYNNKYRNNHKLNQNLCQQ